MTSKANIYRSSQSPEAQRSLRKRLEFKKKVDRTIKLSLPGPDTLMAAVGDEVDIRKSQWVRLIDEGALIDSFVRDNEEHPVTFYFIQTGALKAMIEDLPDDFVGYIDKDHIRSIYLGEFTKEDLKLVEIENGRFGIDVNFKLNRSLNAVADLLVENQHRGLSIEMGIDEIEFVESTSLDEDLTIDGESYPIGILKKVSLHGFAVCREPRDPNAYDRDLLSSLNTKGEVMNVELKKIKGEEDEKNLQAQSKVNEKNEDSKTEDKEAEENSVDNADTEDEIQSQGDADASQDEAAATEKGKSEPEDNESTIDASASSIDQLAEAISALKAQTEQLRAQIAEKDEKIANLEKDLSANSVAHMSVEEKIGTLLASVQVATKTEAEGSVSTTNADDKEIINSYSSAFADL